MWIFLFKQYKIVYEFISKEREEMLIIFLSERKNALDILKVFETRIETNTFFTLIILLFSDSYIKRYSFTKSLTFNLYFHENKKSS